MMKNRLSNLLTVKSIVTFVLTAVFAVMAIRGDVKPDIFITIYSTIIAFYFGTQHEKNNKGDQR